MKRSAQRIFWLITLIFFLILVAMAKLVFMDRQEISSSAYNPRINYVDNSVKRGNIRDSNGDILAESIENADGSYTRNYNRSRNEVCRIQQTGGKGLTDVFKVLLFLFIGKVIEDV